MLAKGNHPKSFNKKISFNFLSLCFIDFRQCQREAHFGGAKVLRPERPQSRRHGLHKGRNLLFKTFLAIRSEFLIFSKYNKTKRKNLQSEWQI
jgi:hypothetical protein